MPIIPPRPRSRRSAANLATVPWSVSGSRLSLAAPTKRPAGIPAGLWLRRNAYRRHPRELLRIELLLAGTVLEPVISEGSGRLVLTAGPARVEIAFNGADGARIRGRGCGLRLTGIWNTIMQAVPEGFAYTSLHHWRRYALRVRDAAGTALWSRWREDAGPESPHLEVQPGPGWWEIAIDGYDSTWAAPADDRRCLAAATATERGWRAFAAGFPPLARPWAEAGRAARRLLWSCTMPPSGALGRPAVLMSRNWMDAVWSWDNWFNLVAIAPADPALAMDQALLMADHQDAHGCYPDSVDADGALYCFNKPPVQGVLLRRLRRTDPRFLTPARRAALFATLAPATRWWLDHRRWPGRRLCHYRHGNDSGWDNSTMFDEGAPLEAPDLNALLAVQAAELARLADGLGHARQAASWTRIARDLRRDLLADLWDGDGFAAVRLPEGRRVRCRSLIPLMPLVLGRDLPEDVRDRLVAAVPGFVTDHGLATEAPDSPDHVTDGYWRGPIWGPSTLLVVDALRDLGEDALATRIATGFCRTCVRHGFAENFAAATGAPLRDPAYTWTAAAYLCLARDLGRPRADRAGA